ncbi:hypothetical protein PR048_020024 [Dryococelus australis]|uniref:Uncharacterized protein n=1 Tax=Dryococelus australis TaxID=614101 RepID=A0ABQ9H559_9NEOP|nr:hypothetical protein PR048_020024 [Dryococelus australis]
MMQENLEKMEDKVRKQKFLGTEVQEKVVGLKYVQSTTGEYFIDMFLNILNNVEIALENCTEKAFHRALNMSSEYSSVST